MLPAILLLALGVSEPQLDSAVTTRPTPASAVPAARARSNITIDGRLDEPAWSETSPVTSLTQRVPQEGAPPTQRTEIRLLYDDDALYVGIRMYDTAPDSIKALLARRDRMVSADRFIVYLDSYHDRRSGFYFGINAGGTLYDGTLYNDEWSDSTWDGVWSARARCAIRWAGPLSSGFRTPSFGSNATTPIAGA